MAPQTWGDAFAEIAEPHEQHGQDLRVAHAFQSLRDALEERAHLDDQIVAQYGEMF